MSVYRDSLLSQITAVGSAGYSAASIDGTKLLEDIIKDIRDEIETIVGKILNPLNAAIDNVKAVIGNIVLVFERVVRNLLTYADDLFTRVTNGLYEFFDYLLGVYYNALTSVRSAFETAINAMRDNIQTLVSGITAKLTDTVNTLREGLSNVVNTLKDALVRLVNEGWNIVENIVNSIKQFADSVKEGIINAYNTATQTISNAIQEALENIRKAIEDAKENIAKAWENAKEWLEKTVITKIETSFEDARKILDFKGKTIAKAVMGEYATFDAFVNDITDPPPVIGALAAVLGGLVLTIVLAPALSTIVEPALMQIGHLAREKFRPTLLDVSALSEAYRRGIITSDYYGSQLALNGFDNTDISVLGRLTKRLITPNEAQALYLRGEITRVEHDNILRSHGYTDNDITQIVKLYELLPNPSDLIRMAVREAFSPDIAAKFGQYEDYPEEFTKWAAKLGINETWAKAYWAAHWDLPSPSMGYEMLHRGIIDVDTLKLLLRALDIMPFWRDKLIQLSYTPYTRVDIRRMYQSGVLTYDEMVKAYRDIGYDETRATKLAEWTAYHYDASEKSDLDEYRQLTRGIYLSAYKRGLYDRDQTLKALMGIGYSPNDASLIVAIADAELELAGTSDDVIPRKSSLTNLLSESYERGLITKQEFTTAVTLLGYSGGEVAWLQYYVDYRVEARIRDTQVNTIREWYVNRTIDSPTAHKLLGNVQASVAEHEKLFALWDVEREARTRKPTEAQFRAALQSGIITIDEYAEELRGLGYPEKYVSMLVKLVKKGQ